jgi:hypothetical protein
MCHNLLFLRSLGRYKFFFLFQSQLLKFEILRDFTPVKSSLKLFEAKARYCTVGRGDGPILVFSLVGILAVALAVV